MRHDLEPSVLIVEDEDCIRDVLVDLFDVPGVVVESAATVADAKARLSTRSYSLILTDIRLGASHDGGLQVMAMAGLLSPESLVVALTAFPDDAIRAASARLGAAHFLEKPAPLERIAELAALCGVCTAVSLQRSTLSS